MIIADRVEAAAMISGIPLHEKDGAGQLPINPRLLIEKALKSANVENYNWERRARQGAEAVNVCLAADEMIGELKKTGRSLPTVINVLTGGFEPDNQSQEIGQLGQGAFSRFLKPDMAGHGGKIYITDLAVGKTSLNIMGRVHPYELSNEHNGNMLFARNFRILQEYARRLRADEHKDVCFLPTYLTGVDVFSNLKIGDIALVVDEMELANDVAPGLGPHGVNDVLFGMRWQPKAGRALDVKLGRIFFGIANEQRTPFSMVRPAISVGNPSRPEFEGLLEVGLIRAGNLETVSMDLLRKIVEPIFGGEGMQHLAQFYDMGISAELAVLRQVQFLDKDNIEPDFPVLPIILTTDLVGDANSLTVNHLEVLAAAQAKAGEYTPTLVRMANRIAGRPFNGHDYSLRTKFTTLGVYK